jgi:exopolysaccharide production protein ExoZ
MGDARLDSVQILRAIAALAVMFGHAWPALAAYGAQDAIPNFLLGAAGVDLFFVISGFIMVYTSDQYFGRILGSIEFFGRRLLRIVPLYWLCTTIYIFVSYRLLDHVTIADIIDSYLFIPTSPPNGGWAQPVLGVGWTLNYEMFFYFWFACAVPFGRRSGVLGVSVILVALTFLQVSEPPWTGWISSFLFEFIFGMAIALAMREGLRIPISISVMFVIAGFALLVVTDPVANVSRVAGWGGGAALIVAGLVLADTGKSAAPRWLYPLVLLGDASYALYLIHSIVPIAMERFSIARAIAPKEHPLVFVGVFFATSIALALILNVVDNSFRKRVRALFRKRVILVPETAQ